MEANAKKITGIAVALLMIFGLGFFVCSIVFKGENKAAQQSLRDEKLKSEKLLSEKMLGEKNLDNLNEQLNALKSQDDELTQNLDDANKKLNERDGALAQMKKSDGIISSLRKQLSDMQSQYTAAVAKNTELIAEANKAKADNVELNGQVASLTSENAKLKEDLLVAGAMTANNTLVQATKGHSDRLTVRAKKTNKIQLNFDLPASVAENVSFKITTPDGKVYVNDEKKVITYSVLEDDKDTATASLSPMDGTTQKNKKLEMIFKPKEKLNKGVYKIDLENNGNYLGTINVSLR